MTPTGKFKAELGISKRVVAVCLVELRRIRASWLITVDKARGEPPGWRTDIAALKVPSRKPTSGSSAKIGPAPVEQFKLNPDRKPEGAGASVVEPFKFEDDVDEPAGADAEVSELESFDLENYRDEPDGADAEASTGGGAGGGGSDAAKTRWKALSIARNVKADTRIKSDTEPVALPKSSDQDESDSAAKTVDGLDSVEVELMIQLMVLLRLLAVTEIVRDELTAREAMIVVLQLAVMCAYLTLPPVLLTNTFGLLACTVTNAEQVSNSLAQVRAVVNCVC